MDVQLADALPYDPDARAVWVHDLRNAVNRIGLHASLAQRLVEKDRPDEAAAVLADCRRAAEEARELLALAAAAVQLGPLPTERPESGAELPH